MDYEEAKEKVLEAFYGLPDRDQVDYGMECLNSIHNVMIFPMDELDLFCKRHFKGKEAELKKIIKDSIEVGPGFDKDDLWCMWDEDSKVFSSAETPADFIEDEEELFENLMDSYDLYFLGFSEAETEEILEAYEGE